MNVPKNLRYTKEHEWVKIENEVATVGITEYAQGELGDVVFVELPQAGDSATEGQAFGTIEAVKAVSELFAPLSGTIMEINDNLARTPEVINHDPYGAGWMIKIKLPNAAAANAAVLLSAEEYQALIGEK